MTNQQLANFTDEQIKAKAHKIWLARQESGESGNADTDWQAAVSALSAESDSPATEKSALTLWYGLGLVALLGIGAVAAVVTLGGF